MRRPLALAAMLCIVPLVSQAQGHVPAPCDTGSLPDWLECPTPYVELIPDGTDDIFARNFLCRETGKRLGVVADGTGACGTSTGISGWAVPESATVSAGAGTLSEDHLRAEIMEHVIDPCYLEMARRNPVDGVSPEAMAGLLKAMTADAMELIVFGSEIQVAGMPDFETRAMMYAAHKETCLAGMEQAGGRSTVTTTVRAEPDVVLGPSIVKLDNQQEVFDELAGLIRAKGWACDSLSAVHTLLLSRGFKVRCNHYAYQYRIEDRGGQWEVTLD